MAPFRVVPLKVEAPLEICGPKRRQVCGADGVQMVNRITLGADRSYVDSITAKCREGEWPGDDRAVDTVVARIARRQQPEARRSLTQVCEAIPAMDLEC